MLSAPPYKTLSKRDTDSAIEVSSDEDSGPEYPAAERLAALKAISYPRPFHLANTLSFPCAGSQPGLLLRLGT